MLFQTLNLFYWRMRRFEEHSHRFLLYNKWGPVAIKLKKDKKAP